MEQFFRNPLPMTFYCIFQTFLWERNIKDAFYKIKHFPTKASYKNTDQQRNTCLVVDITDEKVHDDTKRC